MLPSELEEAYSLLRWERKKTVELEGELDITIQRWEYEVEQLNLKLQKALCDLSDARREIDRLRGIPAGSTKDSSIV